MSEKISMAELRMDADRLESVVVSRDDLLALCDVVDVARGTLLADRTMSRGFPRGILLAPLATALEAFGE